MKKINIFVGSSIVEFEDDRKDLELFIRRVSDELEEDYDLKLVPFFCENVDNAMSKTRLQDEYNNLIKNSFISVFLFYTKAGAYTLEEFNIAHKGLIENNQPKVIVYFKKVSDEVKVEESLLSFIKELNEKYNIIYGEFSDLDTIKLRLLTSIKSNEKDLIKLTNKGSTLLINGKEMLCLDNVNEFINNKDIEYLKKSYSAIKDEFLELEQILNKDTFDDDLHRRYLELSAKLKAIENQLDEINRDILNASIIMCDNVTQKNCTMRMKEAFKLFENGDSFGALSILNQDDIDLDYLRIFKMNQYKMGVIIKENLYMIEVMQKENEKLYLDEIIKRFDLCSSIAVKYEIEPDCLLKSALFFKKIGDESKSKEYMDLYMNASLSKM